MRKYLAPIAAVLLAATFAVAQPTPGFSIDANSLKGTGSNGNPVGLRTTCGTNEILRWSGTTWGCAGDVAITGKFSTSSSDALAISAPSGTVSGLTGSFGNGGIGVIGPAILYSLQHGVFTPATCYSCGATPWNVQVNNYNDPTLAFATHLRIKAAAAIQLTGIGATTCADDGETFDPGPCTQCAGQCGGGAGSGRVLIVSNSSLNGSSITVKHESTASFNRNRIQLPSGTDIVLAPGCQLSLLYDSYFNNGTILAHRWIATAHSCAGAGAGDITGVTVTSPACAAGSFMATLTGGAASGDAPVGGTCVAEVGDISAVTTTANMGLTGGGTGGAVSVGLLSTCANGEVLKSGASGATWTCAADNTGTGESTIAGAGLTLTGTTVDVGAGVGITVAADSVTIDPTYTQRRVSGTCAAGSSIREIAQDGTVTCETDDTGGGSMLNEVVITPTAITGLTNDWNPTSLATATTIRIATSGNVDLTGLSNESDGRRVKLCNTGANTVILYHDNINSTAAKRFQLANGVSWTLPAGVNACLQLVYSSTAARWMMVGHSGRHFPGLDVAADISQTAGSFTTSGNVNTTGTGDLSIADDATIGDTLGVTGITTLASARVTQLNTKAGCAAPTLTCGTSPSVVGCDLGGTVLVGTGSPATCVITFTTSTFTAVPTCVVTAQNGTAKSYAVSATAVTITAPVSSTRYDWVCLGHD